MARLQLNVFFQQDGARESLNKAFPRDWEGRTKSLPRHSPSITPLDFFSWGYVKDEAFRPNVCGVVELHAQINNEVASLTPQMLKTTLCEMECRLDIL
jgi:hypothetical protein